MTFHATLPAEVEPAELADLIADCREISGVLGAPPLDLAVVPSGAARHPAPPAGFDLSPGISTDISTGLAALLDGYADYGS